MGNNQNNNTKLIENHHFFYDYFKTTEVFQEWKFSQKPNTTEQIFEEMSYNYCFACHQYQCCQHSEPDSDNKFTLKRLLAKDKIKISDEKVEPHLLPFYKNVSKYVEEQEYINYYQCKFCRD